MLVLFFCCRSIGAQSPVLKNFTIKDGLPSNEIYDIYQDKKGFIWICTDAGLVKYDANTFRTFNSSDGLPDNTVFEVKEDRHGRIWFRTYSGYIGYVWNDSIYTIPASEQIIKWQEGGIVCSFHIDNLDRLVLGTQGNRISFMTISRPYDINNIQVFEPPSNKNSWMDILLLPDKGFVYSETRENILQKDQVVNFYTAKHELVLADTFHFKPRSASLTRMIRKDEYFALANSFVLREYDLAAKTRSNTKLQGMALNLFLSVSGELFAGLRDRGVKNISSDSIVHSGPYILNNLSNSDMLEDNNKGVWYATLKNGIFYTGNRDYKMYNVSAESNKPVKFFQPYSSNTYIVGFESGGCFLYELKKGRISLLKDMNGINGDGKYVKSVHPLKPDLSFISYLFDSQLFDHKTQKITPISLSKTGVTTFEKIVSYKTDLLGINYIEATIFDPSTYAVKKEIRIRDRISSFAWNRTDGQAYFGALHGLYKFYGQSSLEEKDRVADFRVKDLEFLNNRLYIATKGYGLVVRAAGLQDTIGTDKGILSNVCDKIVLNGNNCWVSSNLGLSRITYHGYKNYEIVNYPLKDFETPSLIQDFFIHDSVLYFASGTMLYSYPLTEQEEYSTPFYVYNLEVNNKVWPRKKNLQLSHDQSSIRVRFAALYYNFTGSVRYRYKLLPNDKNWIYTNENSVFFPSLSPGTYSIILQAQKNNGSWIPCDEKISFTIQKPWWRENWFVLCALLLGMISVSYLTYYLYRRKVGKERTRNSMQIRLHNLEIKAMKAQMNPHFIFNCLNSIQRFILANDNDNAYLYLSKFSKLVRMILESNEQENISIGTEITILEKYLEIEALRFKNSFSYELSIDPDVPLTRKIPHMMIQPFVENAIWHGLLPAKSNGLLSISFRLADGNSIECTIEDNGIGIHKAKELKSVIESKSMAQELIRERLMLLSTTTGTVYGFTVTDKSEEKEGRAGTVVHIRLPVFL